MSQGHGVVLVIYGGLAVALLVAGFIYKEIRDYRENRKHPKFPFRDNPPIEVDDKKEDHVHDGAVATR